MIVLSRLYLTRALPLVLAIFAAVGCATAAPQGGGVGPEVRRPSLAAPSATPSATATTPPQPSNTPEPTATSTPTSIPTSTPIPYLVAIDAGHGGIDLGARHWDSTGHMDFHESDVNLDLALRVRDLLDARGYRTVMPRDGDYRIFDDQDVNGNGQVDSLDEVQARVDLINEAQADLVLSIHQNAWEQEGGGYIGDVGGTSIYYCADRPFSDQSLRFAHLVQERIVEAFHDLGHDVRDRGVLDDAILKEPGDPGEHLILLGPENERIVRPCQAPGILSETLFITHDREAELARDPVALDRLALAYTDAIDAYFRGELPAQN